MFKKGENWSLDAETIKTIDLNEFSAFNRATTDGGPVPVFLYLELQHFLVSYTTPILRRFPTWL